MKWIFNIFFINMDPFFELKLKLKLNSSCMQNHFNIFIQMELHKSIYLFFHIN